MLLLKVSDQTTELLNDSLKRDLNIACVVAAGGEIPDEYDMQTAETRGQYWYRNTQYSNNRFDLFGVANNWWAYVIEESPTHVVLQFSYRYDIGSRRSELLTQLIAAQLSYCCELIEK